MIVYYIERAGSLTYTFMGDEDSVYENYAK